MKRKILVTRRILPEALAFLAERTELEVVSAECGLPRKALFEKIRDKEGLLSLLLDVVDGEVMDAAPRLRIIANCAVGYNNIDIAHALRRGILVTNTPGVLTEATADLTWALILAVARRIPSAERLLREGGFRGWAIDLGLGKDVFGKRLGIIGMGRIGKAVARRAVGFRMETVYFDPVPLAPGDEHDLAARFVLLDELLRTSDIVTIHAALSPETRGLISKERIAMMKRQAILVNVARGPIVDEAALADALAADRIWGAGLDVYEREPDVDRRLLRLENAVLLPHIGSATYETRLAMSMMAARNLVQGLSGEKPANLIPEMEQ